MSDIASTTYQFKRKTNPWLNEKPLAWSKAFVGKSNTCLGSIFFGVSAKKIKIVLEGFSRIIFGVKVETVKLIGGR